MLVESWGAVARQGVLTTRRMVVLVQLVDVRRPRLIDLLREGTTGELSFPMMDLDWSRFLLTGGKYMIQSDWILQVQCNYYWSGNFKPELVFSLYV